MGISLAYVQVVAGLVLLLLGGEVLVRGSTMLARRLGISPLFVGLTVVAFGTSAPEMMVVLFAVLEGAPAIAVGNVVGSNIANILLILGVSALLYPIACHRRVIRRDGAVMVGSAVLFAGFGLSGAFTLGHGLVMLICLIGYISYSYMRDRRDQRAAAEIIKEVEDMRRPGQPMWSVVLRVAGGLAGVIVGSDVLVDGGVAIAREFAISEAVIGLTMFAVGTSLPELATAIIAARHKHSDLALGNVIGSNIFNLLAVVGVVATVAPIEMPAEIARFDLWIMVGVTMAFVVVAYAAQRIARPMGAVFLLLYIAYIGVQATAG